MIRNIPRDMRIGIDIDHRNQFQLLKTYFNARRFGDVQVYETHKGYHVIILLDKPLDPKIKLEIRKILGCDDTERIETDEKRLEHGLEECMDVLFNSKYLVINSKYGLRFIRKISEEYPCNILGVEFWRRFPKKLKS